MLLSLLLPLFVEIPIDISVLWKSNKNIEDNHKPPQASEPEQSEKPKIVPRPYSLVLRNRVNAYATPTETSEKIYTLDPGEKITIKGGVEGTNWIQIAFENNKVAYINTESLIAKSQQPERQQPERTKIDCEKLLSSAMRIRGSNEQSISLRDMAQNVFPQSPKCAYKLAMNIRLVGMKSQSLLDLSNRSLKLGHCNNAEIFARQIPILNRRDPQIGKVLSVISQPNNNCR